jgi:hypothetical protein
MKRVTVLLLKSYSSRDIVRLKSALPPLSVSSSRLRDRVFLGRVSAHCSMYFLYTGPRNLRTFTFKNSPVFNSGH